MRLFLFAFFAISVQSTKWVDYKDLAMLPQFPYLSKFYAPNYNDCLERSPKMYPDLTAAVYDFKDVSCFGLKLIE